MSVDTFELAMEFEPKTEGVLAWLWRWKSLVLGLFLIIVILISAVGAGLLTSYGVAEVNYRDRLQPPSRAHLFGTDEHGRDIFTRILFGIRITFVISAVAVTAATAIGITTGLLAGYLGGIVDMVFSRIVDAMFAFPFVFLSIAIVAIVGPGKVGAMTAIAVASIPQFARVSRSAIIGELGRGYVDSSRVLGVSHLGIVFRSILPNIRGTLLVLISLGFAYATLNEAALSYLGMGAQSPEPALGVMLATARRYLFEAPWYSFFPGFCIFLLVFAFNLVADGLNDILDPRRQ